MMVSAPRVMPGPAPASTIDPEKVPVAVPTTSWLLPSFTVPPPARSVTRFSRLSLPLMSKVAPLATVRLEEPMPPAPTIASVPALIVVAPL